MDTNNMITTNNNPTNQKNITVQYSLLLAAYWMGFACTSAFSSVYMLSLGISNSLIGLTLSLGALASVVAQPYIGMLIDNNPKITAKKVLLTTSIIMVTVALMLYPVSKGVPIIVPLFYGILICMLQSSQSFSNSIGMSALNAGYKLNFGPARAIGSLAYATIAFVLGKICAAHGGKVVPAFIAFSFTSAIIALFIYPLKEKSATTESNKSASGEAELLTPKPSEPETLEAQPNESDLLVSKPGKSQNNTSVAAFFKKYKTLPIIVVGMIFIYYSHIVLNSFALQIITPIGGTSENMGIATAISAGIEVVPMFMFPILKKRFRLSTLLKISAIFFTLKIIATTFATNVGTYYAVQFCQMLGWGIMAVAIVYFINDLVEESDTAQGQAYAGISLTIANVLGNVSSGRIIDSFGVHTLLIIGSVSATFGTIIFWIGVNKSQQKNK